MVFRDAVLVQVKCDRQ